MNVFLSSRGLLLLGMIASLPTSGPVLAESPQTGTFLGVIKFQGEIPKLEPLKTDGAGDLPDGVTSVPDESLVIDKENQGIANVFVYLRKPPANYQEDDARENREPLVLEIKDGRYVPHVMLARTGQKIKVFSRDKMTYCVHPHTFSNHVDPAVILPDEREELIWNFQHPEPLPMQVVCDLHQWMAARLLVVDHPFAAVTDKDGRFKIAGLPPGKYEFSIWQEKAQFLEKRLAVPIDAGETTEAKLFYDIEQFKE